jgi:DNA-binding NtrC family response regulator
MRRARILVVDDKENMRRLFARLLSETHDVVCAEDGTRALALLADRPFDLVVTDIRMPGADGFEVLRAVGDLDAGTEVVLMTAYATVEKAVEAIKAGAYDYLQKPFEPDHALRVIERALERRRLREEARGLKEQLRGIHRLDQLVARSPAMREVFALLERAAGLDLTVLLTGESGTGKELAARAIHQHGARASGPFVAVNCGALPAELVESELFGHTKGAFTGATTSRVGLFREAEGGTILLDEIGDLPLAVQVKLTRVLQEREVRPVGESRAFPVDVRVVAATHRDLKAEVEAGRFREDLFYRLNVFPIVLPPLRERSEDVPVLAAHLLEKHARAQGRSVEGFTPEALAALTGYPFPGNVRELENVIERAVAVCAGSRVDVTDLPPDLRGGGGGRVPAETLVALPYKEAVRLARDRGIRDYLSALLRAFGGNVTRAAEHAGLERESLHRLLKRHGLRSEDFKG